MENKPLLGTHQTMLREEKRAVLVLIGNKLHFRREIMVPLVLAPLSFVVEEDGITPIQM